jgi:membrane protease YdiL (CAAX protease family)
MAGAKNSEDMSAMREENGVGERGVRGEEETSTAEAHSTLRDAERKNQRWKNGWRQSKWLAALDFALVAGIFIADQHHLIFFSKTPYLLALGWISLWVRGMKWSDVGLTRGQSWTRTLPLGIAWGLALELFQLYATQPLLTRLTGKGPDLTDFLALRGNLTYCLVALALVWTLAAFGEELVWRGYLMNRVAGLFHNATPNDSLPNHAMKHRSRVAWAVSLIVVNVAFGFAHSYQGWTGIIEEGLAGAFLGGMYLATGRNLAVPIVAHGVSDTLDVVLMFFGKMPGA